MLKTQRKVITVAGTDVVILPQNPKRKALWIGYIAGNAFCVDFGQAAVANAGGFLVSNPGPGPWRFKIEDLGEMITLEVHAISTGASSIIWIAEAFEP